MKDIKKIQDLCESKGWDSRKFQYHILEELTGVDRHTCKLICSLQRSIRFALPKDATGARLEKDYHMPDYLRPPDFNLLSVKK